MMHLFVQKLLDPKNGYLSTDGDDQSLEVAVTFFATKVECHKKKEE
jgi:hypothetical protein